MGIAAHDIGLFRAVNTLNARREPTKHATTTKTTTTTTTYRWHETVLRGNNYTLPLCKSIKRKEKVNRQKRDRGRVWKLGCLRCRLDIFL